MSERLLREALLAPEFPDTVSESGQYVIVHAVSFGGRMTIRLHSIGHT
jgi:hypothetical protein